MVGPWVFRLATDLTDERAERVRTQERADVAAHLHDSVLQTLALIQKNAGDAATVARLARAQERDLRAWLYADESTDDRTLASALRGVRPPRSRTRTASPSTWSSVGDCDLDEALRPLVRATREAVTNAAKHAGTDQVDVYAEVTAGAVEVFVRDRGAASTRTVAAEDRHGVRRSIIDRMHRHGGTPRSGPPPARAPRCGCTCPDPRPGGDDDD